MCHLRAGSRQLALQPAREHLKHRPGLRPLSMSAPHIAWRGGRLVVSNKKALPLAATGAGSYATEPAGTDRGVRVSGVCEWLLADLQDSSCSSCRAGMQGERGDRRAAQWQGRDGRQGQQQQRAVPSPSGPTVQREMGVRKAVPSCQSCALLATASGTSGRGSGGGDSEGRWGMPPLATGDRTLVSLGWAISALAASPSRPEGDPDRWATTRSRVAASAIALHVAIARSLRLAGLALGRAAAAQPAAAITPGQAQAADGR